MKIRLFVLAASIIFFSIGVSIVRISHWNRKLPQFSDPDDARKEYINRRGPLVVALGFPSAYCKSPPTGNRRWIGFFSRTIYEKDQGQLKGLGREIDLLFIQIAISMRYGKNFDSLFEYSYLASLESVCQSREKKSCDLLNLPEAVAIAIYTETPSISSFKDKFEQAVQRRTREIRSNCNVDQFNK